MREAWAIQAAHEYTGRAAGFNKVATSEPRFTN